MQEKELKLKTPILANGVKTNILKIRSPTVGDLLAAESIPGSDLMKEIYLFACLSGTSNEDIKTMAASDYKAFQEHVQSFLE